MTERSKRRKICFREDHPFYSAQLKLLRGRYLLDRLQDEMHEKLGENTATRLRREVEPFTGDMLLKYEPPELSDEWPLLIGELVHNTRSALEHLAWQLVGYAGNTPKRSTGFPICREARAFDSNSHGKGLHKLEGASDSAIAAVRSIQPFATDRWDGPVENHPLLLLTDLWNYDKHRTLPLCAFISDGAKPGMVEMVIRGETIDVSRYLVPGVVRAGESLIRLPALVAQDVERVDCAIHGGLAFERGAGLPEGYAVVSTLDLCWVAAKTAALEVCKVFDSVPPGSMWTEDASEEGCGVPLW